MHRSNPVWGLIARIIVTRSIHIRLGIETRYSSHSLVLLLTLMRECIFGLRKALSHNYPWYRTLMRGYNFTFTKEAMEARHQIILLCNWTNSKYKDVSKSKCVYFPSCSWFQCVNGTSWVSDMAFWAEWFHVEMRCEMRKGASLFACSER